MNSFSAFFLALESGDLQGARAALVDRRELYRHGWLADRLASVADSGDSSDAEPIVLEVLRHAIEDGEASVFRLSNRGAEFMAPVGAFIRTGMDEAIGVFIDQGFDPLRKFDGVTAIEFARGVGRHETAALMASRAVRDRVAALVESLSGESLGHRGPA